MTITCQNCGRLEIPEESGEFECPTCHWKWKEFLIAQRVGTTDWIASYTQKENPTDQQGYYDLRHTFELYGFTDVDTFVEPTPLEQGYTVNGVFPSEFIADRQPPQWLSVGNKLLMAAWHDDHWDEQVQRWLAWGQYSCDLFGFFAKPAGAVGFPSLPILGFLPLPITIFFSIMLMGGSAAPAPGGKK